MPGVVISLIFSLLLGAVIVGTGYDNFALWKVVVFSLPLLGFFLLLLFAADRLRFLTIALVLALPFLGLKVPPASMGVTLFDLMSILVLFQLLYEKAVLRRNIELVPVMMVVLSLLLLVPAVLTSIHVGNSFESLRLMGQYYLVFVMVYHLLTTDEFGAQFPLYLSLALVVVSLFVFLEQLTGINFNFGAAHTGQYMIVEQLRVHRVAGIFQDPQKAAQFLAVGMTYLAVLLGRGNVTVSWHRVVVWVSVALTFGALLATVSRAAIISGVVISLLAVLTTNRFKTPGRIVLGGLLLITLTAVVLAGSEKLGRTLLPKSVVARLSLSSKEIEGRKTVWRDSWRIFTAHPLTGIGPGNYQELLMQEKPILRQIHEQGGMVPDMPESGYLKVLYEVGIVGSIGVLLLAGTLVVRLLGAGLTGIRDGAGFDGSASLAGLVVFALTSGTIFTPSDPRNALLIPIFSALMLAAATSRTPACADRTTGFSTR